MYQSRCTGRVSALERLRLFSRKLSRSKGGFVLIGGESGVGKTRLLMEFGRELARTGILVLTGECFEMVDRSLEVFLKPLQAIADRCRKRGLAETERLLGRRGKILAIYEPGMSSLSGQDSYPDPVELQAEAATFRLFSYLSETLRALTTETPVALLLDDLQWADELALGFFEFVLSTAPFADYPLVILGAYRSEAVPADLDAIIDSPGVERIHLDRLDETSIATLIGDKLGLSPPPGPFSRYLSLKSTGNPLFVSEYLRVAIDTGLLVRGPQGKWQLEIEADEGLPEMDVYDRLPIPTSLQGLIERRLEKLPGPALAAVEVAAIIGREGPTLLLWAMTGLDEKELLHTVDVLLQHQILEQSSAGIFRFCHAQIRDISLARLEPEHRQELHARAAENIELVFDRHLEQHQAKLGAHWQAAGEVDKARSSYLAAARQAKERYDYQEAVRCYNAYLQLVTIETEKSMLARKERGDVLFVTGRHHTALQDYEAVLDKTEDQKLRMSCLRKKATILETRGDIPGVRKAYQEALAQAHAFPLEHARTLAAMANFKNVLQSKHEEAEQLCQKALDLFISLYPDLHACLQSSFPAFRTQNIPQEELVVLSEIFNTSAGVYYLRGDLDQALDVYQKSLKIFEKLGDKLGIGVASGNIGNVFHSRGDLAGAQDSLVRATEIFNKIKGGDFSWRIPLISVRLAIAEISSSTKVPCLEEAAQVVEKARCLVEEARHNRRIVFTVEAHYLLGLALKTRGMSEEAHASLSQALTLAQKHGYALLERTVIAELEQ
ncbi:AAA family ATPase [candidate division CSSED10-310 bacterium]|uniref:AAA family ATPase n=1 Tax=candidate division CSSED10-310 bacterium TaxID=2855610 RepID=A0ABV6Z3Y6_UNCC1